MVVFARGRTAYNGAHPGAPKRVPRAGGRAETSGRWVGLFGPGQIRYFLAMEGNGKGSRAHWGENREWAIPFRARDGAPIRGPGKKPVFLFYFFFTGEIQGGASITYDRRGVSGNTKVEM